MVFIRLENVRSTKCLQFVQLFSIFLTQKVFFNSFILSILELQYGEKKVGNSAVENCFIEILSGKLESRDFRR